MSTTPIRLTEVPAESVGRSCPYCRFPLKASAAVAECPSCRAMHHADCWSENVGCAVNGCGASADSQPTAVLPAFAEGAVMLSGPPSAVPPPQFPRNGAQYPSMPRPQQPVIQPPQPPLPGKPAAGAGAPASGRRVARTVLLTVAILLALGGSGAALFIALSRKDDTSAAAGPAKAAAPVEQRPDGRRPRRIDGPRTIPPRQSGRTGGTQRRDVPPTSGTSTAGSLPNDSQSQMESDIADVIREHHQDIVGGDYRGAWNLLSARKQAQYEREHGYSGWQTNQESLTPYLQPSGASVTIDDLDRSTGVARISVSGMGWTKSSAPCSDWSGITWAKYEGGEWKYDPGYSATPERRRNWKPRKSELLGVSCSG